MCVHDLPTFFKAVTRALFSAWNCLDLEIIFMALTA
jgi:hypothetical protein